MNTEVSPEWKKSVRKTNETHRVSHASPSCRLVRKSLGGGHLHPQQNGLSDTDQLLHELNKGLFAFQQEPNYKNLFPNVWLPTTFQVLTEAFTEENQMINSTMKMVRYKIIQAHWDSLEYMYTEEGTHFLNPGNRAAVNTLFPKLKS